MSDILNHTTSTHPCEFPTYQIAVKIIAIKIIAPLKYYGAYANIRDKLPVALNMELVTVALGLATIVGTGALAKVGENMTDRTPQAVTNFLSWLAHKLPHSKAIPALRDGKDIDYNEAAIELEPILKDPEVKRLLEAARSAVEENEELKAKLEEAITKIQPRITQINRDHSQGNQFNGNVTAGVMGGNNTIY